MTEQENQTSEEKNSSAENAESTTTPSATTSSAAPSSSGAASRSTNGRTSASSGNTRGRNERDYDDDDDYDDYDDYDYDDYEDEDGGEGEDSDEIREIRTSGPADYVPSTQRGRSRRINLDIKLEELHYKNIPLLTRFLDPRGRILSRRKTGVSAKIQRRAVTAIKQARHLALLPFTAEQTRVTRLRRRSR